MYYSICRLVNGGEGLNREKINNKTYRTVLPDRIYEKSGIVESDPYPPVKTNGVSYNCLRVSEENKAGKKRKNTLMERRKKNNAKKER